MKNSPLLVHFSIDGRWVYVHLSPTLVEKAGLKRGSRAILGTLNPGHIYAIIIGPKAPCRLNITHAEYAWFKVPLHQWLRDELEEFQGMKSYAEVQDPVHQNGQVFIGLSESAHSDQLVNCLFEIHNAGQPIAENS